MSVFDRVKQGITLLIDSIDLIRNHPRLALFPLVGGLAGLGFLGLFLAVTFGAMAFRPSGAFILAFLFAYLAMTFISTYFTAGLVHQTRRVIEGDEVSIRDGLAAAWGVKGRLFIWSLIAATVGILLNSKNDSRGGGALGVIFGVAWTLMTFLIVPVIVFERTSVTEMFKRSAGAFKQTWGETPIGLGGVQVVSAVVALPIAGFGYLLLSVSPALGIGLIVAGIALGFLLAQTLEGVIKTVLYLYATEGKTPREFDNVDFEALPQDTQRSGRSMARQGI